MTTVDAGTRPPPSAAVTCAVVAVVGLVAGVATSFGQQYLPEALHSLANSATSWSVVAVGLALLARGWSAAITFAVAAFVLQLVGYEIASELRLGFGMAPTTWAYWLVLGAVAGPVLGLAGWWVRHRPGVRRALGVALVAGIAIGEGVYGLTVVAATTSPVWWWVSIALGVVALAAYAVTSRSPRLAAVACVAAAAVAAAFRVAYAAAGGYVASV